MSIRPARRIRSWHLRTGLAAALALPLACSDSDSGCDPGTSPGCESATEIRIISDDADPSITGEMVRVRFEVTAAAGEPSGLVEVTSDAGSVERCTASAAAGYCDIPLLSAGPQTLRATYLGGGGFSESSDTETHIVERATTTTTVVAHGPDPSALGEEVEVSFSVVTQPPASGTPSGLVVVSDGLKSCSAKVRVGSCSLVPWGTGVKTLTVTYEGDVNFQASEDSTFHEVSAALPRVTLATDPDASVVGQTVTVIFGVTAAGGTPTGTVTVTVDDGSGAQCSVPVEEGRCELTFDIAGEKTLTAAYSGDADFLPAEATASHQVDRARTRTVIESDWPDPSLQGQEIDVRFSVSVRSPGRGTPTGNVTIGDGTDSCTVNVAAGTCKLTLTQSGKRILTATYEGDANFQSSSDEESHGVLGGND